MTAAEISAGRWKLKTIGGAVLCRNGAVGRVVVMLLATAVYPGWTAETTVATKPTIVVLTSLRVPAYQEALDGLTQGLDAGSDGLVVVDLGQGSDSQSLSRALDETVAGLVITIGTDATLALAEQPNSNPYISTMVLGLPDPSADSPRRRVGVVTLNVSIGALVAELKQIFPEKRRLGILRNPATAGFDAPALRASGEKQGFRVEVVDCSDSRELISAFLSLRSKVDFVWCLPDDSLYNSATLKPLIQASLRNRLPIIGFSAGLSSPDCCGV